MTAGSEVLPASALQPDFLAIGIEQRDASSLPHAPDFGHRYTRSAGSRENLRTLGFGCGEGDFVVVTRGHRLGDVAVRRNARGLNFYADARDVSDVAEIGQQAIGDVERSACDA